MNIKELKTILKQNKIHFYTYWDKKRLVALANKHNLLPKTELEKEKSQDVKYDRLKTIKKNPRKVMLENIETGEIGEIGKETGIINTRLISNNFIIF